MKKITALCLTSIGVCFVLCVMTGTLAACRAENEVEEQKDDHGYLEGYYLKCDNGNDVIIVDADGANAAYPAVLKNDPYFGSGNISFDDLTDGDRIKISAIVIQETYPAQIPVVSLEKLSDGEPDDIDSEIQDELFELGWIDKLCLTVPDTLAELVDGLLQKAESAILTASPVGSNPKCYFFEEGLTYYRYTHHDTTYYKCTLQLPDGYNNGRVIYASGGAGSGEMLITVTAMQNGEQVYLEYLLYSTDIQPIEVFKISDSLVAEIPDKFAK